MSLMTVRLFLAAIIFIVSALFVFFDGGSLGACIGVGAFVTLMFVIPSLRFASFERRRPRDRNED